MDAELRRLKLEVEKVRLEAAYGLGMDCATAALEAGGPDPVDCEGKSMLPCKPLPGDWECLSDTLAGDISDEEEDEFVAGYASVMANRS